MGQSQRSFKVEIKKTVNVNYMLYLPERYNSSSESWPLLLFLHGASERGDHLKLLEKQGPPMLIAKEKQTFPFIILSPQCPQNRWWSEELQLDAIDSLLDEIISLYRVDANRIYVTGLSMGGSATWRLAAMYPHRFAAIAPICGFTNPKDAHLISRLPIWVFHGALDPTIPIVHLEKMVAALKENNSNIKFTVYPDSGHDSWTETYSNPALYEWFLIHSRPDKKDVIK